MRKVFGVFLFIQLFFCFSAISQKNSDPASKDTLFFLNGNIMPVTLLDSSSDGVTLLKPMRKNKKQIFIESDRLFSIKYANGSETILYKKDTMTGNDLTVEETRFFMRGERDAKKWYKARIPMLGGIIVGGASVVFFPSVISFIPPFAYSAILMLPKIKIKKNMVSDPELIKQDSYLMGYERVALKKKTINSLIGGGIGVLAGFIVYSHITKNL